MLNNPPFAFVARGNGTTADLPAAVSLVLCSSAHVVVDTIKQAEDGNGLIVRMYEAYGQRGPVTLAFARPIRRAILCNLIEENGEDLRTEGKSLTLSLTPYQLRSLRVELL